MCLEIEKLVVVVVSALGCAGKKDLLSPQPYSSPSFSHAYSLLQTQLKYFIMSVFVSVACALFKSYLSCSHWLLLAAPATGCLRHLTD